MLRHPPPPQLGLFPPVASGIGKVDTSEVKGKVRSANRAAAAGAWSIRG